MPVYNVTYDLNKESTRPNIVKRIKDEADGWALLSESSYAVVTNLTPHEFYKKLSDLIDGNDNLMVMTISRPYYGQHKEEVIDWLEEHVPR